MTQLQPGAVTNIPIPEDDAEKLGILGLMLEYNEKVKVKVELEKLSKLPSNVEPLNSFKFYNIVEIKVIDETTGKPIEPKGWIKFVVSKKWLESNGYDPDKVVMLRYHYKWEELHTEKTISDSENVYYKAYTPGFSIFAVAVPTEENATVNETTNTTTIITNTTTTESTAPTTSNENTAATSQQPATTSEKTTSSENTTTATETSGGSSWTLIIVGIIILIIIVAGAYFYMDKKNS
ncbi:PGF-pre-PGF domain-containing protein [Methanocaldococcus vulcanius]|uniref:PGF-pre-PGF domain-containing protein n=1 Tax=Methanocaldococcus vulcanius TaxID=73913 RepID=UPI0001B12277|nr:PGF-pre-PGF domain-containing protein [Methanocaldococcus vulcanius]